MRHRILLALGFCVFGRAEAQTIAPAPEAAALTVNRLFGEALAHQHAYENLRVLTSESPGRLSGSTSLQRAVNWAESTLNRLHVDRVYKQDVMVPHWERGARESARVRTASGTSPLTIAVLGGSAATPTGGVVAEVVEVRSLQELTSLGRERVAGRIVFFNRAMDPAVFLNGVAYREAGDQRNAGPAAASRLGAVAALTRSLTFSHDDVPHTGATAFPPEVTKIPAAALSTIAADRLAEALAKDPAVQIELTINARWLPDAPSHNVIGEIRGTEFPDEVILVGGHLDSWDIAPGAHDDGAGVVQSIEVLRLFRTLDLKPRHTLRCVLFTNEENGGAGAAAYSTAVKNSGEKHLLALESDNGGFSPNGFNFGSTQGDVHVKAERWRALFEPWGIWNFRKGVGGSDVHPLMLQGVTVAGLSPDSQRYFDYHHTAIDSIDKVNPRELALGAAGMAALIWLVDREGL